MAAPTLSDFIRRRMDALRTDTIQIEQKYGLDADWTRGFIAGRGWKQPNKDRVRLLAKALQVPERELWAYLGRFDLVAESQGQHLPDETMPAWAARLEEKVDALSVLVRELRDRPTRLAAAALAEDLSPAVAQAIDQALAARGFAKARNETPSGSPDSRKPRSGARR